MAWASCSVIGVCALVAPAVASISAKVPPKTRADVFLFISFLGRVDGFDQDEAEGDGDEGTEVLCCLLASKRDPLEALELADRLFDARPRLVERFREVNRTVDRI